MEKYREAGFLFLRVSYGIMFIVHGLSKVAGGFEEWETVGGAVSFLGINFGFLFFGVMAILVETVGGLFFMLGLYFRQACLFLAITMLVAFSMHYFKGDTFIVYSHALESFFIFVGFLFIGPGKMSVQK